MAFLFFSCLFSCFFLLAGGRGYAEGAGCISGSGPGFK